MAKIHILEKKFQGEEPNRTGVVCAVYHVNLSGGVVVNPSVPVTREGGFMVDISYQLAGKVQSASMILGVSNHPTLVSTHPDFGATPEGDLLTSQDIAEIEISYHITEKDSNGAIASELETLYTGIQNKARTSYRELLEFYATERNPA